MDTLRDAVPPFPGTTADKIGSETGGGMTPAPLPPEAPTQLGTQRPIADIQALSDQVKRDSQFVDDVLIEVGKVVVGQKDMVDRVIIGLLTGGHCLIEGVPGLAK